MHIQQRYARRATLFDTGEPAADEERGRVGEPLLATESAWPHSPPMAAHASPNSSRRRAQSSQDRGMGMRLNARVLHARGFKGKGVRVAVMDSGLPKTHPDITHIAERTDWTDDGKEDDTIGHGTFVAGVIGGKNRECAGLAPEAELHAVSQRAAAVPLHRYVSLADLQRMSLLVCLVWLARTVQGLQLEVPCVYLVVHRRIQLCHLPTHPHSQSERWRP